MTEAVGGILIILATSLFGYRMAQEVEEAYRQMQYIQRLFAQLQSEIRYTRAWLGEAFCHMGRGAREPYRAWLLWMSRQMEEKGEGLFADIWESGVNRYLAKTALPKEERNRLLELGGQFGMADAQMQLQALELYQEQLSVAMREKREGMRTKMRLCRCLGVMAGIFLTVLLI